MALTHPWPMAGIPPFRFVKKGRPVHARLPVIELPLDDKAMGCCRRFAKSSLDDGHTDRANGGSLPAAASRREKPIARPWPSRLLRLLPFDVAT